MNATPSARRSLPLWLWVLLSALLSALAACSDNPPPNPTISVQPTDTAASVGSAATLSVSASGLDLRYQWQQSSDGGSTWTDIAGATQASHTTPPASLADNGKRFRVVVAAAGTSVTSSAVTLTVTAVVVAPSISIGPVAQTITAGQDASFSVTAAGTALAYQWQRSTDAGTSFDAVVGATLATLNLSAVPLADNGQRFRVVVSNGAGGVTSSAALLTVNAPAGNGAPAFSTQPADIAVTAGQNAQLVVAVSGTPTPTLQWQMRNNPNVIWGDLTINGVAQTGTSLDIVPTTLAQNGFQFRVLATNSAGVATSAIATLTVNAATVAPSFTTQPLSVTIVEGQNAQFTVAAAGTPTPALQWQFSTDGSNWNNINGATATVFNVIGAALANNGRRFRAVASNSAGSMSSNAATLTVNAATPAGKAWQTAVLIETGDAGEALLPQIAVNAQGDAIAVWQQSDGVSIDLYANRYTAAAGWGTAQKIEADDTGVAQNAQVAIDTNGNAIAVWQQPNVNGRDAIWANRYTAGTGWGAAALIESGIFDAGNPQVAIDGSGNAIAVWWQSDGARNNLVANRYVAGSGWGTAAVIETDSTGDVSAPQIAMDTAGNAIAVWAWASAVPNGPTYEYTVWANRYTAASGWGTAGPIDSVNNSTANPAPHVALDGSGNAIAVWHRPDGSWDSIWANRYAAGSGWGTSVLVETDNTNSARDARVAFDANGNALAVWTQSFGGVANVMANRYAAGIGWGTAVLIETDDAGPAFEPRIVVDGNGNATAVWSQRNIAGFTFNIWTNRYTAGVGWGTAKMIDSDANPARVPQIGVDANGNAIAVWQQDSGGIRPSIWANTFR